MKIKLLTLITILGVLASTSSAFALNKTQAQVRNLLSKKVIIGLELIEAGAGDTTLSGFGHTLLRFVDNDSDWGNDLVVGFAAEYESVPSTKIGMLAGFVYGRFPIVLNVSEFKFIWYNYLIRENRKLKRTILLSNEELLKNLITNLDQWLSNPLEFMGNYRIVGRNCANIMVELLKSSGFPKSNSSDTKPIELNDYYSRAWIAPYPVKNFVTKKAVEEMLLKNGINIFGMDQTDDEKAQLIKEKLSYKEVLQVLSVIPVKNSLKRRLLENNESLPVEDYYSAMGADQYPVSVYSYCETESCADEVVATLYVDKSISFVKSEIERFKDAPYLVRRGVRGTDWNDPAFYFYNAGELKPAMKSHYKFLVQSLSKLIIKKGGVK